MNASGVPCQVLLSRPSVSVPKGSTGDSHPVLTTPRGPHVLAPPLPDTGSLPVTQGCFTATLALCTSWPCTGGVKVLSPPTAFLCLPLHQHQTPTSLTQLVQGGQCLSKGSGPGWRKAASSGVSFPSPCYQAQGSTGR